MRTKVIILSLILQGCASHQATGVDCLLSSNFDCAISEFTHALTADPSNVEIYTNRGVAYSRKGLHAAAIADFNQAIELNPHIAGIHLNKGSALERMGRANEAMNAYKRVIEEAKPEDGALAEYARRRLLRLSGGLMSPERFL